MKLKYEGQIDKLESQISNFSKALIENSQKEDLDASLKVGESRQTIKNLYELVK